MSSSFLVFEDRPSDSPLIERVWRSHSERAGTFQSVASSLCEMVVSRVAGRTWLTLRGPETRATVAECPADGEWFGVRFSAGTYLREFPASRLIDRNDVNLPDLSGRSFLLSGTAFEYPNLENAEVLVSRLVSAGLIGHDSAVGQALKGDPQALSRRSTQRHFLLATGITHQTHRQIGRARYAVRLLRSGASILDAVHLAGYFDQAHLTRSMRHRIGETPARIARGEQQLSFLYNTNPPD